MSLEKYQGIIPAFYACYDAEGNAYGTFKFTKIMLERGAIINYYMFCGGTNFGWMNGANFDTEYKPIVNSYDSDALLTESGDIKTWYAGVKQATTPDNYVNVMRVDDTDGKTKCFIVNYANHPDTYGNNKTGTLLDLCKALFAYSDSAKAFFTRIS